MAHITIDKKAMSSVCNEDLIAIIQDMIHTELMKPEADINADFVEECVNALLEIEQDIDRAFVALVPLVKRKEFISRITGEKQGFRGLNKFARVAIAVAIITSSTLTANAAVEAVTDVNLLRLAGTAVQEKLEDWGVIKKTGIELLPVEDDEDETTRHNGIEILPVEDDDDEETTTEIVVEPVTHTTTMHHGIELLPVEEDDDEETTTIPSTEPTTAPHGIELLPVEEDDDETTTQATTVPTTEATTRKPVPPTTVQPVIPPTTEKEEEPEPIFVSVEAEFDNFKTDYIYGESLTYEGLKLSEVYSDGSRVELPLEKCNYTKAVDMTKTADYTLRIIYKTSVITIDITVRPDEETRGSEVCSNELYDYYLTDRGSYVTAYRGDESIINLNEVDGNPVYAIGEGVFREKSLQQITAVNVLKLFANSFKACTELEMVDIPNIEYLGNSAFDGCSKLKASLYNDNMQYIGTAVYRNSGIESLALPPAITSVPAGICEGCSSLKSVELLGEVEEIAESAFEECIALEKVNGTGNIKTVKALAFYNDSLVEFDAEPTLEAVGDYAFAYCNNINITKIGTELKAIGIGSFMYCYNLSEVVISGEIEEIPESAFRGAHISSLTLEEGVRSVGSHAFMSIMTRELWLPETLKSIGDYSFYITFLRQVHFAGDTDEIPETAFYRSSRLTFYVYEETQPYNYAVEYSVKYIIEKGE